MRAALATLSTSRYVLQGALNTLYGGDVNKVDFIVGALLERPNGTALVGPLFAAVMRDQYIRTRDGDRFWFENTADARNRFTDDEVCCVCVCVCV